MKRQLLAILVALQAAWIVATVAVQETRLHSGTVVLLETAPVDPRDLLRGDYVILNYKISTIPASLFPAGLAQETPPGMPVFVRLEKRGEFHEVQTASLEPIDGDAEHPVLRGKISARWAAGVNNLTNRSLHLDYGLERFYVREGTGNPQGTLTVEASVSRSGIAAIRQVFVDGKPYAEAMKDAAR
jgi:uncharacterized membrane-anchored protein